MKEFRRITTARVTAQFVANRTPEAHLADGLQDAATLLELVSQLMVATTENGLTDPRAVAIFLNELFEFETGRSRTNLQTAIPVDVWDREAEEMFKRPPRSTSTLAPDFSAAVGSWVSRSRGAHDGA